MAQRPTPAQLLTPSVLDRLIDDHPESAVEASKRQGQILRELKQTVRRDLENLLNTRVRCIPLPPGLEELEVSLANYGIPDFTGSSVSGDGSLDELFRSIEKAVQIFEPRLKDVRVESVGSSEPLDRTLRFRISAVLHVEPIEERMCLDSEVEPVTGTFRIREEGR